MHVSLHAPDWQTFNGHHWRGYAWLDGQPWTPADYQQEELASFLTRLNGCFSWIGTRNEQHFAVADRLGSYPLFYGKGSITDRLLPGQLDINWQWLKLRTWHFVEALPGCRTLDDGFLSVSPHSYVLFSGQVGQEVRLQSSQVNSKEPFPPAPDAFSDSNNLTGGRTNFRAAVLNSCHRLINYAAGRTIVVLLSDGYDSRLILAALKQLNYPNLVAATYGIVGNGVVERAREIVQRLDVPFHFINYADPAHAQLLLKVYPQLISIASNGQSVVQEQEIFAAYHLRHLVPPDSILVPGISGDLQAGSYVPPYSFRWAINRRAQPLKTWLRTRLTRLPAATNVAKYWEAEIKLGNHTNSELSAVQATEAIIVQERLNKYLCTTLRAYELAGFNWYLPLWDKEFVDFWNTRSIESRRFRKDYRAWCKADFFQPLNVHFAGEGEKPRVHLGRILKRFLPFGDRLATGVTDPNELCKAVGPLVGREVAPTQVNTAMGDWLIAYYENLGEK